MIGNSSSRLLEAPSFKIATINIEIGKRGELSKSVIDCLPDKKNKRNYKKSILIRISKILKKVKNPYAKATLAQKLIKS